VLQSRSLSSRPWLIAVAGLIVTAGITAPFFFVTRLGEQLAIAAVLSVAAAVGAWLLAMRLDSRGQELVDAERKYQDLTDGAPLVTWVYGAKDRNDTRLVGPQIEATVGYSPEQWDGELLERILHPDDRDRVLGEIASAAEQGVPLESEYRVLGRNGEVVWLREHGRIVSGPDGEPRFGQSFLVDIGELKSIEDEKDSLLAAQRAAVSETGERQGRLDLLREVADAATSPDYKAAIERVAELVVRDFGDWCLIDLAEEGSPLKRLAVARAEPASKGGAPQQEPDEAVRSVVASGNPQIVPALGERSNGQEPGRFLGGVNASSLICVPLRARQRSIGAITVARIARGRPYGADDLALVEDIAGRIALAVDRARLYAEVEQRADAARVLAHVADGILLLDRSGVVRLWNPAAEGITAIRAGDIVGRSAADAIPGWQESVDSVPIAKTPDPGHPEVVIPLETERGERWIAIAGVQFFGGTVYAFRDLTDVRRLEELKASFIATASHELRTPLAAVYGAAQTLLRHDFALDEGGRDRFVSLIADESERLGRIVNEILLASQLDAGRLDLASEPFDAAELVERVVEATRAYAPPGIHVEGYVPDDLRLVEADRD
jgi:PAS domain S-box-containing protein